MEIVVTFILAIVAIYAFLFVYMAIKFKQKKRKMQNLKPEEFEKKLQENNKMICAERKSEMQDTDKKSIFKE